MFSAPLIPTKTFNYLDAQGFSREKYFSSKESNYNIRFY